MSRAGDYGSHRHFGQIEGECRYPDDCDCWIGRTEPMLTDAEIEFLRARLGEDEKAARDARACAEVKDGRWFDGEDEINDDNGLRLATVNHPFVTTHIARHDPARVLREVAVWRRLLLDYQTAPLDAAYGGTEREVGFRLALSAALKAKIATYAGNPVTGEPFPRELRAGG